MKRFIQLLPILLICTSLFAQGQRINVPADQPTIQSAINASVDGDTVLVADGTYFENINFIGKAITLASHFLIDGDEIHIDSTIINGSQPSHPDSGAVVLFDSGEDTTTVLYGFTITGGTGSLGDHGAAGGIGVAFSGGKILYNKIIKNSVGYDKSYGGGIAIVDPTNNIIIAHNIIADNILSASEGRGGGIFCIVYNPGDRIYIVNNIIMNNSSFTSNGGGGISINGGNPIIKNNLIKNNYGRFGGGVQYKNYTFDELGVDEIGMPKLNFVNNTIVNNKSDRYAGIHSFEGSIGNTLDDLHPTILNSIIWGNKSNDNLQIHPDFIVKFSDIEGGVVDKWNMDLDPQFVDTTNFYLSTTSPCVDAGDPDAKYNDLDGSRNDMGCYGGHSPLDMVTDVKEITAIVGIPDTYTLSQNYPNPFNPTTTINYSIPSSVMLNSFQHLNNSEIPKQVRDDNVNVMLKVYDILGREVAILVNQKQNPGNYEVTWDASNVPSGVYFYQLTAGASASSATGFVETKKMLIIK